MKKNKELPDLMKSPGFIMINTSWRIKDELRRAFLAEGYDVTPDQFAVLIRLWEGDGLIQTELSEKTLKAKSNLTRILDSMEKKGLVSRRINKDDRRSFSVYLTPKGKDIKNELVSTAITMNNKIFRNISSNDRKNLLRILDTISCNLG